MPNSWRRSFINPYGGLNLLRRGQSIVVNSNGGKLMAGSRLIATDYKSGRRKKGSSY